MWVSLVSFCALSDLTFNFASDDLPCLLVEGDWIETFELPSSEGAVEETPEVDGSDVLDASAALRTAAVVSCNSSRKK